ncbi:MAG TPA: hypothetical protein PK668_08570 [Myxococcota bacterium]|nr:hypothetical protein [Myxococcota bacterium]HRY92969.1 hypothetical protein [Myxococcota bacterium]HSA22074.1 hypothetical protein [Myxococcota bacterium]
MNARNLLAIALVLSAAPGCVTKTYTLKPEEVRRVAEELGTRDEIEADAQDKHGQPVRILVRSGDGLRIERQGAEPRELDLLAAARDLPPDARFTLKPDSPAPSLLIWGLSTFAAGWGLSVYPAVASDEWMNNTWCGVIPLGGPLYIAIITGAASSIDWGGSSETLRSAHHDQGSTSGVMAAATLSFLLQAAGLGLTIAGAVEARAEWDREVGRTDGEGLREEGPGVTLGFEPVVTPDGAVGGLLTGRF